MHKRSLIYQTALQIIACSLVVGVVVLAITTHQTRSEAGRIAEDRLNGLLSAVESTVSIACFTADEALAREVGNGLMRDPAIRSVLIESYLEGSASPVKIKIAELVRPQVAAVQAELRPVIRNVHPPFFDDSGRPVGVITVYYEERAIKEFVDRAVKHVALELVLMLVAITGATLYVMLYWVVRPMRHVSKKLHTLNVVEGERLDPTEVKSNELHQLTDDINALADNLVASLAKEHALRLQGQENETRFRAIFENAETGLFLIDAQGRITSHNRAFERLVNPLASAEAGLAHLGWTAPEKIASLMSQCFETQQQCSLDSSMHAEGHIRYVRITLAWVNDTTAQGVAYDITDSKEAEAAALRQALCDPLTGTLNRHGLEEAMASATEPADPQNTFALLAIDLIGFRKVNEALGMLVGNDILKTAALRISRSIKSYDLVARTNGDKFIVLLREPKSESGIASAAERIRRSLDQPFDAQTSPIILGAAIGISRAPEDGKTPPELILNAELAMRQAKIGGGKECMFFSRAMADHVEYRRALEVDMANAISAGEFRVHYQPIVNVANGLIIGAEALIRWQHPIHGMIPPDRFIPIAEETGQIVSIGLWMVEEVASQLAIWKRLGHPHYVSINVSGRQIPDGLSPAHLANVIKRHGISPDVLVLEITEGVLLSDVEQACTWLAEIRAMGIRVYLDDFGTGYSSLSYLKRFPLDTVKIDRSFIRDLANNQNDQALVKAIISMAHSLSMDVVAEGLEDKEQLGMLHALGCENAQGYFYSRPVPAAAFIELLSQGAPQTPPSS